MAFMMVIDMDVSKNSGTPKSSILIGFSIMFTIHFGVLYLFLETPIYFSKKVLQMLGGVPGWYDIQNITIFFSPSFAAFLRRAYPRM